MSKTERRVHQSEYVNKEWYYAQLAEDWYLHDWVGDTLIMRKMSENGYGDITAQQASIMKYATIWELNKQQIRVLMGKAYREQDFKDWEQMRQKPLEEYKEWLTKKEREA